MARGIRQMLEKANGEDITVEIKNIKSEDLDEIEKECRIHGYYAEEILFIRDTPDARVKLTKGRLY